MLKKLCACGASIPINQAKCKACSSKDQANYDKYHRKNKDIYKSRQWVKLTELCKNRFNGIDVYAYYKHNRLVVGTLSHHIIEVNEDKSRAFDLDNLIYVSDRSHKEIHERYKRDKATCQKELQKYISLYQGVG